MPSDTAARIVQLEREIACMSADLAELRAELTALRSAEVSTAVNRNSPPSAKLALYSSLFTGRTDAYAVRWTSNRTGKSGWSPAVRGGFYTDAATDADLLPIDEMVLAWHLTGCTPQGRDFHAGLYPMMTDDTCKLLACDFDGGSWREDTSAYAQACASHGVPVAIEISRSGDGAHAWLFFEEEVPAQAARRLGAALLQAGMAMSASLGLGSYDRFFPAQDLLPSRSPGRMRLGNLIALPLQGTCRKRGTTVFADPRSWQPFEDQFAYLSTVQRFSSEQLAALISDLRPVVAGPANRVSTLPQSLLPLSVEQIELRHGATLDVPTDRLPPGLTAELKHLASVPNPEFYRKQAQRFSTFGTPRHVLCFQLDGNTLRLPRGLHDQALELFAKSGITASVTSTIKVPPGASLSFTGDLRPEQTEAVSRIAPHDTGVLVAPPGAGKTVMACALIAARKVPTAIIVNRAELVTQWRTRLTEFLDIEDRQIGQLGNGRRKRKGLVDLIMLQSISHRSADPSILAEYGQIIIDECHAIAAPAAEAAVRNVAAKYWLGLTATPYRADQLDELITMQCGPVRFEMEAEATSEKQLIVRTTTFTTDEPGHDGASIQAMYGELAGDSARSRAIADDVVAAHQQGRRSLVLTNRLQHLESLEELLRDRLDHLQVLHGRLTRRERAAVLASVSRQDYEPTVLLAIDKVAGEGLDLSGLDTLFLTMPISFRGRIVQQVGRIGRSAGEANTVIRVHDYHDERVPLFDRMFRKRRRVLARLGWQQEWATD